MHRPARRWRPSTGLPGWLAACLLAGAVAGAPAAQAEEVLVFAAASLTDALAEVGHTYERQSDDEIRFSFASSSTLARQIEHGARADIYASANIMWMDYLEKRGQITAGTRVNLLANKLVLIAPVGSDIHNVSITDGLALEKRLDGHYLAMGNPAHVPAGIYGKEALKSLGVWRSVKDQIARSADVRAALALVASGEAPLGIVYKTDALAADDARIVAVFPKDTHTPVVYPIAMTPAAEGEKAAQAFFEYLQSDEAARIFEKYGFTALD